MQPTPAASANRLLIVEDDPDVAALIALVADDMGFETTVADPLPRVIDIYRACEPDLILLDLMMPGADGVQVLRALANERCDASIVLLSAVEPRVLDATSRIAESLGLRLRETLRKPVAVDDLRALLARYFVWSPSIPAEELRTAIADNQLEVLYQPIVRLSQAHDWIVDGGEALVRWRHPDLGMVGPEHFIALAEEEGLIAALTRVVLRQALTRAARLRDGGYDIAMAVNLSTRMLEQPATPELLATEIARHGIDPARLSVEIAETVAVREGAATECLTRLRLMGVRLSMDDFGVGWTSLVQLYRVPFGELKIDRSLIRELAWSAEARTFLAALIALAHSLGVEVCAEGVETPGSLEFLRAAGCDRAQGHLFSPPLSEDEFMGFLHRQLYRSSAAIAAASAGG